MADNSGQTIHMPVSGCLVDLTILKRKKGGDPMKVLRYMGILPAIVLATAGPVMAKGDAAKGKLVFAQCAACHKIDKAGGNGIGPNLFGVVGRPSGSAPGFSYSPALSKLKITWTVEKLDGFLTHPAGAVPGTRMPFAGIKDPASRQNLIAYLMAASR